MKKILPIFFAGLGLYVLIFNAYAEEKKPKELPKSGSLSRSIGDVYDSRAVPEPWGGTDAQGSNVPPIAGSVSKVAPDKWVMKIFNNSEDTYSVNVAATQYDRSNRKVKSDSFSYTLKPKQKVEREVPAGLNAEQGSLDLVSWKKFETAKPTVTSTVLPQ